MPVVGAVFGILGLVVATLALLRPFHDQRRIRVAFQLIEDEFEELRAEVKAALGRIYRLKGVQSKAENPPEEPSPSENVNGLTPHQLKVTQEILARRRRL